MTGKRMVYATLTRPLRIHTLSGPSGVWMSDRPCELNQMVEAAHVLPPAGRVLIGGLGLGIMAKIVAMRERVESVTVVEICQDVIDLANLDEGDLAAGVPSLRSLPIKIVKADIYEYLKRCDRFDTIYLDTWQRTGEDAWWSEVMPLRRIIGNRFGRSRVHCWAENVMLGQVRAAIANGMSRWYYSALPAGMTASRTDQFVRTVGLRQWEYDYGSGIDRYLAEYAEEKKQLHTREDFADLAPPDRGTESV